MTVNQGGVGLKTGSTPFKWNAAGGYQHIPFTGLYHVGAREYDPRTARWLQRDPIGQSSGDPNVYRYCLNDSINLADPSGLDFIIFVHGAGSNSSTFDSAYLRTVKKDLGAVGHHMFDWSTGDVIHDSKRIHLVSAAAKLAAEVRRIRSVYPHERIVIIAHSAGGNVATASANSGATVDLIVRLGTPSIVQDSGARNQFSRAPHGTSVINAYDLNDHVQFEFARIPDRGVGMYKLPPPASNWINGQVATGYDDLIGRNAHSEMKGLNVWFQLRARFRSILSPH